MADPLVIFADFEMFLTGWYRAALAARPEPVCQGVMVDNKEPGPDEEFPEKLLVIRDDGGPDTSIVTNERSVGISVLAGTVENPQDANDLARIVHALRTQIPAVEPGNPVAAVLSSTSPVAVVEAQPRARRYSTVTFALVGESLQ